MLCVIRPEWTSPISSHFGIRAAARTDGGWSDASLIGGRDVWTSTFGASSIVGRCGEELFKLFGCALSLDVTWASARSARKCSSSNTRDVQIVRCPPQWPGHISTAIRLNLSQPSETWRVCNAIGSSCHKLISRSLRVNGFLSTHTVHDKVRSHGIDIYE